MLPIHEERLVAAAQGKLLRGQAKLFRGLADPSRLSILAALRPTALSVGEIVAATGLTQSNVSNHLACLRECGLVRAEPQGRFVYYRLGDERVAALLDGARELFGLPCAASGGTPAALTTAQATKR